MSVTGIGAPEGATHYGPDTDSHCESWYRVDGGVITAFVPVGDYPFVLSPAQAGTGYYHAVDELVEIWTGKGAPPAGAVCERRFPEVDGSSWRQVTILLIGDQKIFYRDEAGDEWANRPDDIEFRPIRTPEQIAAEKRIEEINEMAELSLYGHYAFTLAQAKIACAVLHDKGYRKVTP